MARWSNTSRDPKRRQNKPQSMFYKTAHCGGPMERANTWPEGAKEDSQVYPGNTCRPRCRRTAAVERHTADDWYPF
jgi:hypothetical protein